MLIAVLSDIHANREAFEAVLAAVDAVGAQHLVLLGDIVGYGADPEWCVQRAITLSGSGAVVLCGNHDRAVSDPSVGLNAAAQRAMDWTRNQLGQEERTFLAGLPLEVREEDRLYVHAEASAPEKWRYVLSEEDAAGHFASSLERVSFCGHVHVPALYCTANATKAIRFTPAEPTPIPLLAQRRWLAVMGAVGQPRDGDPSAAFGLFDTSKNELCFMRVPYDVDAAAQKVLGAGLPGSLAKRLAKGR